MGVTVAIVLLLSVFVQGFATFGNLRVIASNSAALLILSCGMGMVVISRGLDLSMIAIMVAGAATFATFSNAGFSEPAVVGLTLLTVAALGLANGWLIAYVEIPAMLATLASAMAIAGFFRFAVLRGEFLLLLPPENPAVVFFSKDIAPGLSAPVAAMIITFVVTRILLRFTTLGRITYAMGDNVQAARLIGLRVRPATLMIYMYAALTALVAGLVIAAARSADDRSTRCSVAALADRRSRRYAAAPKCRSGDASFVPSSAGGRNSAIGRMRSVGHAAAVMASRRSATCNSSADIGSSQPLVISRSVSSRWRTVLT
jgi:ribose transport system permease protein